MTSFADQRRFRVLAHLDSQRRANIRELSYQLGVSEANIRKDLEYLEELGLIKRVRDGAVTLPHYKLEQTHLVKMDLNREKKERIGQTAAGLIQPGESVILDSGTTPLQVAHHICIDLRDRGQLTIYTASLPILREIGACPGIRLILLGGIYLHEYEALAGPQTVEILKDVRADKVFIGADGITISHGITTAGILEADVNRHMLETSKEMILVADSSKIGLIGLVSLAPLSRVNTLVTDCDAPPGFVETLRNQGMQVILA